MKRAVSLLIVSLIITVTILLIFGFQIDDKNEISVQEVKDMIGEGADILLLDVRTAGEFNGQLGHLENAILIPLAELESRLDELEDHRNKNIIVYCRSGNRSRHGTKILRNEEYKALNMTGGMLAWNRMMTSINQDSAKVENETIVQ